MQSYRNQISHMLQQLPECKYENQTIGIASSSVWCEFKKKSVFGLCHHKQIKTEIIVVFNVELMAKWGEKYIAVLNVIFGTLTFAYCPIYFGPSYVTEHCLLIII